MQIINLKQLHDDAYKTGTQNVQIANTVSSGLHTMQFHFGTIQLVIGATFLSVLRNELPGQLLGLDLKYVLIIAAGCCLTALILIMLSQISSHARLLKIGLKDLANSRRVAKFAQKHGIDEISYNKLPQKLRLMIMYPQGVGFSKKANAQLDAATAALFFGTLLNVAAIAIFVS